MRESARRIGLRNPRFALVPSVPQSGTHCRVLILFFWAGVGYPSCHCGIHWNKGRGTPHCRAFRETGGGDVEIDEQAGRQGRYVDRLSQVNSYYYGNMGCIAGFVQICCSNAPW